MTFGKKNSTTAAKTPTTTATKPKPTDPIPAPKTPAVGTPASVFKPAYTPTRADASVLLSGLMGMRPRTSAALSSAFSMRGFSAKTMGRRPTLTPRKATLGGSS